MLPDLNLCVAFFTDQLFELLSAPLTRQYATLVIFIPALSCENIGFRFNITNIEMDQAKTEAVADRMLSILNDGTFLMQDIAASSQVQNNIDHPGGPLLYTLSCMHCMTVSLAENGAGLGHHVGRRIGTVNAARSWLHQS